MKKAGQFGNDRQVIRLEQFDMTAEQRGDAVNYEPGMVIEFHQKAAGKKLAGFQLAMDKKGETFEPVPLPSREKGQGRPAFQGYQQRAIQRSSRLEVIGRDEEGRVYGKNAEGGVCLAPIWDSGKLSVHERELMPLTAGDRLRFTGNGETKDGHRIINGQTYQVANIRRNGDIEVIHPKRRENAPWVISKDFGQITHGYVSTSVAAQGSKVDRVLIAESVSSGRAASMKQFYVSCSRARESVKIFTEDKGHLLDLVNREGNRLSATEVTEAAAKARENEVAPPSNMALVEMVAKHIQWEKAKAKALGVVESVKKAALSVAKKAFQAGISPLIGEQALAMAGGLTDVRYIPDRPERPEESAVLSRSDLKAQAAVLGLALKPEIAEGSPVKPNRIKELARGWVGEKPEPASRVSDDAESWDGQKPESSNRIKELKADAERARKTREMDMRDREAALGDDKSFADLTDSSRWDIRQEQQAQRDKERKVKNKELLADMSARFRKMRTGPD